MTLPLGGKGEGLTDAQSCSQSACWVKNCDRPILHHQWDVFFVLLRAEGRAAQSDPHTLSVSWLISSILMNRLRSTRNYPPSLWRKYWKIGKVDFCSNCVSIQCWQETEPGKNWLGGDILLFFLLREDADWIYKYSGAGVLFFFLQQASL